MTKELPTTTSEALGSIQPGTPEAALILAAFHAKQAADKREIYDSMKAKLPDHVLPKVITPEDVYGPQRRQN